MAHLGDFDASTVVYGKFTTYRPSTGAAYTLGGTPALSVYKDNSTTQSTTGVTLTADFDAVTGLNHFTIDTSADGTFYAAGSFFDIVITTGTVDSVSVVGSVVGSFTLRKNSALKPTTAARTLDVSAGGEAGIDWANVGSPTTAVNLSGTNIDVDQVVASVSGAVGSVTGAVGSVTGAVGSVTGNVNGNVVGSVASVTAGVTLAASAVQAVWDALTSALTAVGSIGKLLVDNVNATISSRLPTASYVAPLDAAATRAAVGLASANLDTQLDALPTAVENADAVWDEVLAGHLTAGSTGNALNAAGSAGDPWSTALPGAYGAGTAGKIIGDNIDATISSRASPTNITAGTITTVTNLTNAPTNGDLTATMKASVTTAATASTPALSTAGNAAVADKILGRNLAGGSDGTRTVQDALRALRNKTSIAAGTLTVTQEDDTTAAWTAAVTTAAGDPLTSIDPA